MSGAPTLSDREKRIVLDDMDRAARRLAADYRAGHTVAPTVCLLYRGRFEGQSITWPSLDPPEVLVFRRGLAEPTLFETPEAIAVAEGGHRYYRVAAATYRVGVNVLAPGGEVLTAAYYAF